MHNKQGDLPAMSEATMKDVCTVVASALSVTTTPKNRPIPYNSRQDNAVSIDTKAAET